MNAKETLNIDFRYFFVATIFSVFGMDLYVFTQGWCLLDWGGSRLSIGLSWAIFFLPGLLLLPLSKHLIIEKGPRKTLLAFEFPKALLLLLAIPLLDFFQRPVTIYLLSGAFGLVFSPFYSAVYALLKEQFTDEIVVKHSSLFEAAIQIAGIIALTISGFLYQMSGFKGIAATAAVTTFCSFILFKKISQKSVSQINSLNQRLNWLSAYFHFWRKPTQVQLTDPKNLFGIIQTLPQNLVLLFNVPLILYVQLVMGKGPIEYGILDSAFSVAAMFTCFFWAKYSKISSNKRFLLFTSLMAGILLLFIAYGPARHVFPYLFVSIFSIAITSSKIITRAIYIKENKYEFIAENGAYFQMIGNFTLVVGAVLASYVMNATSPSFVLMGLGIVIIIYGFFAASIVRQAGI